MSKPIDIKEHFICLDNIFFVIDILRINYYDYSSVAGVWLFKFKLLKKYYYHDPYAMSGVCLLEGGKENRK
jgi:hypothetical protein